MRATMITFWLCLVAVLGLTACGGDDPAGGDAGTDSGADGSTDTDADSDADSDQPCSPEIDDGTGVYWLQCLAGQCLVDEVCAWEGGETMSFTYDEAVAACPSGYRLPTIQEIMGLLGNCEEIDIAASAPEPGSCDTCPASTVCNGIYPGIDAYDWLAPEIVHWSSTGVTDNDSSVWSANFQSGLIEVKNKALGATAACVRTE
jgi:hypothetical protein